MNLPGLSIFVPSCGLWQHVAKTPEVFTYDADGNISEYVSAADVSVAAHYDYSPFGEQLVASGPLASSFTHRFSTKPYCQTTGFCEYQMRKYRPGIGRWMSRDPIGEGGGINLLSNHNQWILMVDYLGLENCIQEVVSVSAHGSRYSINMKTGNYSTGDFDGRARKTGNGRWDAADTGKGLFDILENYSKNDNCGRCHCIKVLHIHSHANGIGVSMRWDSGFSIKNPEIITLMNWGYREETSVREGEARDIKDLKAAVAEERIRFCEDGIVIFYGCWTGSEEGLAARMSGAFPELTIVGPIDRASAVDEEGNIVSGPPQKEVGMGSKPGWNKWKKGKSTTIPGPISFYPSNPLNPLWKGGCL